MCKSRFIEISNLPDITHVLSDVTVLWTQIFMVATPYAEMISKVQTLQNFLCCIEYECEAQEQHSKLGDS